MAPKTQKIAKQGFKNSIGRQGEDLALAFLVQKGWQLVDRNWTNRYGEIDLIVQKEQEIRFVEVKARRTLEYGYPEASVTRTKLTHLRRALEIWLSRAKIRPKIYQIDVIAVLWTKGIEKPAITWIENVF